MSNPFAEYEFSKGGKSLTELEKREILKARKALRKAAYKRAGKQLTKTEEEMIDSGKY